MDGYYIARTPNGVIPVIVIAIISIWKNNFPIVFLIFACSVSTILPELFFKGIQINLPAKLF